MAREAGVQLTGTDGQAAPGRLLRQQALGLVRAPGRRVRGQYSHPLTEVVHRRLVQEDDLVRDRRDLAQPPVVQGCQPQLAAQ